MRPLYIAVPGELASAVRAHIATYRLLEPDEYQLLSEPYPRGSAVTCAFAAALVKLTDPSAIMTVIPASLGFPQDSRWITAIERAYRVAATERIAVLGSTRPDEEIEDLNGLIRPGAELKGTAGALEVRAFIAHPDDALTWRAQQQNALWSTHIFMLRASLVLSELRHIGQLPDVPSAPSAQRIAETARFFMMLEEKHWSDREAKELLATLPDSSFEELVFEVTEKLAVIPTSIEFIDLSNLRGYEKRVNPDAAGNRLRGKAIAVETRNSTVLAYGGKLVVTLGVQDIIVVDMPDATLITTRDALRDMPLVTHALKNAEAPEL
ncbi:MAG: hypothetical protein LBS98_02490 [Coriobacteriales bacterium]|nr:hypothetical protein [Coriobacteriales bacterium]